MKSRFGLAGIALVLAATLGTSSVGLAQPVSGSSLAAKGWRSVPLTLGVIGLRGEGTGLSLGIGYQAARKYHGFQLLFADMAVFPHNNNGRYRSERLSNGQTICRDSENGQFAESNLCGPRSVYSISPEAFARVPLGTRRELDIGAGYRFSTGGYAALSIVFDDDDGSPVFLRGRFGDGIADVALGFHYARKRRTPMAPPSEGRVR